MKKTLWVLCALILFASCAEKKETAAWSANNADSLRIISAAPSNTEIIVGLGLGGNIVACDKWSKDIAGIAAELPEVDFFYPDIEAVLALDPDIIITNEINNYGASDSPFKALSDMGIKVEQIRTSTTLAEICADIVRIANAVGCPARGEKMAADLITKINEYAAKGKTINPKKKVFFEVTPAPSLVTFGTGTYLNEMIEIVGAENIFASEKGWFSPGAESILERNPDVILTMDMAGYGIDADPARFTGFETVAAVKEKKIFPIDADSSGRPSQNIVFALDQIARAVYPEIYGPR
jgi:iron complex transport system substrate-binding protein